MTSRRALGILAATIALASVRAAAQEPPAPPPPPPPRSYAQSQPPEPTQPPVPAPGESATVQPAPPAAPAVPAATSPVAPSADTPPQQPVPGPTGVAVPEVKVIQPEPEKKPPPKPVQQAAKAARPPPAAADQPASPAPADPAQSPGASPGFAIADTVKLSPVGGSEISVDKVASGVATVSQADVARQGASTIQDVLQAKVPGVTLNDLQGGGFQTDIQYRGFSASPVDGVAQGLAVYQNGVRINEAFGDTVNLDLIPQNAINDITVFPNNPVFGLNALGGAVSIGMKDGFNYHGSEIDARLGSFGRRQFGVQTGQQAGAAAIYADYEDITDRGWREFSPAHIRRFYGDLGFKDGENELHFNITRSDNSYGVVVTTPVELLSQAGWNRVWTNPQTTENILTMPTLNASLKLDNETKVSGVAYYRNLSQRHVDANPSNAQDCGGGLAGFLCDNGAQVFDQNGHAVSSIYFNEIDRSRTDSDSFGASAQLVNKSKLFGHTNQFLIGASYDHGVSAYETSAEFATINPGSLVTTGSGIFAAAPFDLSPRNIRATNDYYGIFFSDAFDVTDSLTLTGGGRYNYAQIQLQDLTGAPEAALLNGTHVYERFNPMLGATYKLIPGTTAYASYAEANRAPVAAELACSDPANPCIIPSFLTADPNLKQVVAHSYEAGLRGELKSYDQKSRINWSLGGFFTLNQNDLLSVNVGANATHGYFQNAGDSVRKGLEAALSYRDDRLMVYGAYSYTDATFETAVELSSPNAPQNQVSGASTIFVKPGDHIPGIPQHKFKAGVDYWLSPKWKAGIDMVAQTDQYFHGDESNQNRTIAGFATFNLHTSYDLSKNLQVYGLVNNLFDARYATYGAFQNLQTANSLGNFVNYTDPRSITPAAPFAAYGGVKLKF